VVLDIATADVNYNGTWWTITLGAPLPALTANSTIIDGTTQPGHSSSPLLGSATQTVGVGQIKLGQFQEPVIAINANGNDGLDIGTSSIAPTGVVNLKAGSGSDWLLYNFQGKPGDGPLDKASGVNSSDIRTDI